MTKACDAPYVMTYTTKETAPDKNTLIRNMQNDMIHQVKYVCILGQHMNICIFSGTQGSLDVVSD